MPYKMIWVNPAVFLTRKNITVFHAYKDGDVQNGPEKYRFTTNLHCEERSAYCACGRRDLCTSAFDVRELPNWKAPEHPPFLGGNGDTPENRKAWDRYRDEEVEEKAIRSCVIQAINRGILRKSGLPQKDRLRKGG